MCVGRLEDLHRLNALLRAHLFLAFGTWQPEVSLRLLRLPFLLVGLEMRLKSLMLA